MRLVPCDSVHCIFALPCRHEATAAELSAIEASHGLAVAAAARGVATLREECQARLAGAAAACEESQRHVASLAALREQVGWSRREIEGGLDVM